MALPFDFGKILSSANSGNDDRQTNSTGGLFNRSSVIRGFSSNSTVAKDIPRFKFSFFARFDLSGSAMAGDYINNVDAGHYLAALKSIDMPVASYEVEKIKQYNKPKNITVRTELNDVTVVFYDDATSFVRGLLQAYRAHYTYVGSADEFNRDSPLDANTGVDVIRVTASPGGTVGYPSVGLRSVTEPFFNQIIIHDVGSEPSSANLYYMLFPTIKEVQSGGFDYSDNEAPREITVTFAYEQLIETIGVPWRDNVDDIMLPAAYQAGVNATAGTQTSHTGTFRPDGASAGIDDIIKAIQKDTVAQALARAGTGPGPLLEAIQKSTHDGEINFADLEKNVFSVLARGTAIQNIRIAARNALLIRQAIQQGNFLGVISLLGTTISGLPEFSWKTVGKTVTGVESTIVGSTVGGGSWIASHLNPGNLIKTGGGFGS